MIFLREATNADMSLVFAWHQNRQVNQGFFTLGKRKQPLEWWEHYHWWTDITRDWAKFMVMLVEDDVERPIGFIRISPLEDFSPQIGFTIGDVSLWGYGYGTHAVRLALDWLKKYGYKHTHTSVLKSNKKALNLLKGLGFKEYGEARKGELWLQRKL